MGPCRPRAHIQPRPAPLVAAETVTASNTPGPPDALLVREQAANFDTAFESAGDALESPARIPHQVMPRRRVFPVHHNAHECILELPIKAEELTALSCLPILHILLGGKLQDASAWPGKRRYACGARHSTPSLDGWRCRTRTRQHESLP